MAAKGRTLESLEVTAEGKSKRARNTNPNDKYPAVGVVQEGGILNSSDGTINIKLNNNDEKFDLHLYKGSMREEDISKLTIKAVIDGKIYEEFINIK